MDGVLVIDKPAGITSHDVVAIARRTLHEKRIGHTGTLDPLATGVLPLACGKATRLVRFLTASDKCYEAVVRFGITTDSYDITGNETGRVPGGARLDDVAGALSRLKGDYLQMPPPYSAKKIEGVRAYTLARNDRPVNLEPVRVRVSATELLDFSGDRATMRVTCSAGFYVRSFAHELGEMVGTGGCLEALRRVRSGEFALESALRIDELQADEEAALDWMIPMSRLLLSFPAVTVTDEGRLRVSHGRELTGSHYRGNQAVSGSHGWIRVLDPESHLLALAQRAGHSDVLHPQVVLV